MAELRKEYRKKIAAVELVEPTYVDRLRQSALGVGERAEAAKRVLERLNLIEEKGGAG